MTPANPKDEHTPWFAKAGATSSIVAISRFVGPNIFALKGGGYGWVFSLAGVDEEGMTDQELDATMRSIEGALPGLPEGSCLMQYIRVRNGCDLPRRSSYENPVTAGFVRDRMEFLERTARFRRIDLHWCLTIEPERVQGLRKRPLENAAETTRMLAELQKCMTILRGHLGNTLGLRLLDKQPPSSSSAICSISRTGPARRTSRPTRQWIGRSSVHGSNGIPII